MTPVHFEIKDYLDAQFVRLDSEKITRWLMCFSENAVLDIDDCRGGRISYGGVEFGDTPRLIYWTFMRPCLDDIVAEAFRRTVSSGEKVAPYAMHQAFDETGELLKEFVKRVYRKMVEIDQRLMDMESRQRNPEYDARPLILELQGDIDARVTSLKSHGPVGWRKLVADIKKDPKIAWTTFGVGTLFGSAFTLFYKYVAGAVFGQ